MSASSIKNDDGGTIFTLTDVRSGSRVVVDAIPADVFETETTTSNDTDQPSNRNIVFFATLLGERFSLNPRQTTSQVQNKKQQKQKLKKKQTSQRFVSSTPLL